MSSRRTIGAALLFLMAGCSSTPTMELDIDLGVNEPDNPLLRIEDQRNQKISGGIYFTFESLRNPPASIEDVDGAHTFSWPELTSAGLSATRDDYKIDTSLLHPTTYYRVVMQAIDVNGIVTHRGVGDCPVSVDFGSSNHSTICFGTNSPSSVPLCPDTVVFNQCPIFQLIQ